jgi:hypothetical protein
MIHASFVLVIIGPSDLGLITSLATVKISLSCPIRIFALASKKLGIFRLIRKHQVVYGSGSIHVKHLCPICYSRYCKINFFRCVKAFCDFTYPFAAKRHGCPLQSNTFGSLMINQSGCHGFIT